MANEITPSDTLVEQASQSPIQAAASGLTNSLSSYLGTTLQSNVQANIDQRKESMAEEKETAKQQAELERQKALESQKVDLEGDLTPDLAEKALPGYGAKMVQDYNTSHPGKPLKIKDGMQVLKQASDTLNPDTSKDEQHQDSLEKQYDDMLLKVLSNRSGGLGLTDAKVNQAQQLRSLMNQFYDSKTDTYNIPPSQHSELAIGYAKLLSGNGTISTETENQLRQKTAKEGLAGGLIWLGADPKAIGGTTDSVAKMFRESLDRQGLLAESQRNHYLQGIHQLAPTGLHQDRIDRKNKANLVNSYSDVLHKSPDQQKHFQNYPVGKVRVINPDGKAGFIPAGQLQDALKEGYKQG